MKFLLVFKQKKNVDTFLGTIHALTARGHTVALAVQERHDARIEQIATQFDPSTFALAAAPVLRTDAHADTAPLLRSLVDCLHYQQPALREATKLQVRTIDKLREEIMLGASDDAVADLLRHVPAAQIQRLRAVLDLAERHLPTDGLHDEFLRNARPDVVLVSPLVHFGSAQADIVASARALGLPVGMLLFSWDNLSTKGRLHHPPDWMFVWNEQQRREAVALHGFPGERVVIVGAPRFDAFFALGHQLTRENFFTPLGLDPAKPTLLYVCSSPFVSAGELAFVRKWLAALRASGSALTRTCNVIVRPHPDVPLLGPDEPLTAMRWPALHGLQGRVARPFDDPYAVVLRTSDRAMQGLYECIGHSAAVVGLNTSAELEAAIVGKPVYTVLAGARDADGQGSTLHFHYLLEQQGGFVRVAPTLDDHVAQIDGELASPSDATAIRAFVHRFLRPLGSDSAVSPLLAEAIERTFARHASDALAPPAASVHVEPHEPHEPLPSASAATASSASATGAAQPPWGPAPPRAVRSVAFEKPRSSIQMYVPDGTSGRLPGVALSALRWLQTHVGLGDVLYDIGAGDGLYTVLAVKHRGATVVAFEAGYVAFGQLCDNVILNRCDGSVIAVPVALADFEGLGTLKFPAHAPGQRRYAVQRAAWRPRRPSDVGRPLVQPVCVTALDALTERYALPLPHHMRLSDPESLDTVLGGASRLLDSAALRSVFVSVHESTRASLCERLAALRWEPTTETPRTRGRADLVFTRRNVS